MPVCPERQRKIYCMYPAAETEKVATIKQEIKSIQSGIADNFKAERKNGVAVMEDTKLGKVFRSLTKKQATYQSSRHGGNGRTV